MSNRYPSSNHNRSARSSSSGNSRGTSLRSDASRWQDGRTSTSSSRLSSGHSSGVRSRETMPSHARQSQSQCSTAGARSSSSSTSRGRQRSSQQRNVSDSRGRSHQSVSSSRRVSQASIAGRSTTETNQTKRRTQRPTRRRRRRPKLRGWVKVLLVLLLVLLVIRISPVGRSSSASAPTVTDALQQAATGLVSDEDKSGFDETIGSDSAILINADNGDVLYTKDADTERAPASLTKMMTVYVAIKNNEDLDKEVKMPAKAIKAIEDTGAASSGLSANEVVTVRDLLYAAILPSGADAANALALITSGNEKTFVELMNDEAKKMGLDSTHFANVTGLDDDDQYSTCRDMARLLKMAMGDSTFEEVLTTRSYTTSKNETRGEGVQLTHTMDEYLSSFQRYFDTSGYEIVGGKTGYTVNAGNCLASVAEKKNAPTYIAVTMHAVGNGDQYYQSVKDAVNLYGKAYE